MSKRFTLATRVVVFFLAAISAAGSPAKSFAQSFASGVDLGWLTQLESLGYTYEDQTQTQMNAMQILKNHGVNAVRVRTFVNPTITAGVLGVGNNNQAGSIALAQAANSMGLEVMIDFHYSDTWADPGHQAIPAAWSSFSYAQMETALYNYTFNFMTALLAAGVTPKWVQVGNEIDNGMLLPIGSTSNFTQLTGLINNGYNAVKAVSPSTQVIIHHSTLSGLSSFESFFDTLKADGGEFDIIGASYYDGPGTLATITSNMDTLASRYGKPIMICEIGHTYSDYMGGADDVKSAIEAVKSIPNGSGLGVFYWEPDGPDDSTTGDYSLGAVSEPSSKLLQFTPAMDQYLFTGGTSGNQIIDPTFSTALNGWQITTNNIGSVYSQPGGLGTEMSFWKTTAYNSTAWQDVTALPDGSYTMSAWIENGGGQTSATMFAWPTGGSEISINIPTENAWTEIQIPNIQITQGEIYLGFSIDANAGDWTNIEQVQFTLN